MFLSYINQSIDLLRNFNLLQSLMTEKFREIWQYISLTPNEIGFGAGAI